MSNCFSLDALTPQRATPHVFLCFSLFVSGLLHLNDMFTMIICGTQLRINAFISGSADARVRCHILVLVVASPLTVRWVASLAHD